MMVYINHNHSRIKVDLLINVIIKFTNVKI